jgi:hypothetical protein
MRELAIGNGSGLNRLAGWRVAILLLLTATALQCVLRAEGPSFRGSVERGRDFLASLFDPELKLLPEFEGARVYWLFHDNYLAAKVLARTHPEMSAQMNSAIHREGVDKSGKIEIVFGEAEKPLPFRQYELREVRRAGDKIIRTEVVTSKPLEGWQKYADLLLLASLAEGDQRKARGNWESAMKMWDGKGFMDAAAAHAHRYATYKLGLALLASRRFSSPLEPLAVMREKLKGLQSKSGGWITDYDSEGKPVGLANVETTCLVILGLEAIDQDRVKADP